MDLSIVIISHNRKEYLKRCLSGIFNQKNATYYTDKIEVMISTLKDDEVDFNWIREHNQPNFKLEVILDETSEKFNRSRARNKGVSKARGRKILYLDSDIIISKDFFETFWTCINKKSVGVHYLYGYKVKISDQDAHQLLSFGEKASEVDLRGLNFSDYRDQSFGLCEDDLNKLLMPWVLAWSGILSVPKQLINDVHGFGESFSDWGGEDTDFAYRLYQTGASFELYRGCFGVHMPHETQKTQVSDASNRHLFHEKYQNVESELITFYPTFLAEKILVQITQSYLLNVNHTEESIASINQSLALYRRKLSVGLRLPKEMNRLNFDYFLVVDIPTSKKTSGCDEGKKVINQIGLLTNFVDDYFDIVYVFDSFQFLPDKIYHLIFKELNRISKRMVETNFVDEMGPYTKNELVRSRQGYQSNF